MYGCNVLNKLDKMSFLITRSWLYKDNTEESDENDTFSKQSFMSKDQPSQNFEKYAGENSEYGRSYRDPHLALAETDDSIFTTAKF